MFNTTSELVSNPMYSSAWKDRVPGDMVHHANPFSFVKGAVGEIGCTCIPCSKNSQSFRGCNVSTKFGPFPPLPCKAKTFKDDSFSLLSPSPEDEELDTMARDEQELVVVAVVKTRTEQYASDLVIDENASSVGIISATLRLIEIMCVERDFKIKGV
mmetsp:Transcript_30739/g.47149  ORF Transcript_30739/g.47149 Transcript_30739/m.47149 type:complete len:157 (+) Transcript_30739:545-1015(+)